MDAILQLFAALDPLLTLSTLVSGVIIGFMLRDWDIDRKTIYFLIVAVIPFSVGRFILVTLFGLTTPVGGLGALGTLYFNIHLIGQVAGRLFGKKKLKGKGIN